MKARYALLLLLLLLAGAAALCQPPPNDTPTPLPDGTLPSSGFRPAPKPHIGKRYGMSRTAGPIEGAPGLPVLGGLVSPDGAEEMQAPLPASEKKKNIGGRDGAGLCVFTSIEYAARWCCERPLFDLQQQMRQEDGGGWPEKVDQMIARYAPGVEYLQSTTGDMRLLRAALASGRQAGVTYNGHDPHYRGSVAHMVALVHCTERWCAVSDNNFPGDSEYVWMAPAEFEKRHRGTDGGWSVVLLRCGPPPVPKGGKP